MLLAQQPDGLSIPTAVWSVPRRGADFPRVLTVSSHEQLTSPPHMSHGPSQTAGAGDGRRE